MEWSEEIGTDHFNDERLDKRFHQILEKLSKNVGCSIPDACGNWADSKAAYRFVDSEKVASESIFSGHCQSTAQRMKASDGLLLCLQDTSEFVFDRKLEAAEDIGGQYHTKPYTKKAGGLLRSKCGLFLHTCLVVTSEGLPLGIATAEIWKRDGKRPKYDRRTSIEDKESFRWLRHLKQASAITDPTRLIHIGDRESDMFEFFSAAAESNTRFLVRACRERVTDDGELISDLISKQATNFTYDAEVTGADGKTRKAKFEVKYGSHTVCPPKHQQKLYEPLEINFICVRELTDDPNPLHWMLATNEPVTSPDEACEKIGWYLQRWQIEMLFKTVKSGCGAEKSKMRSFHNLSNIIAIYLIVAWRIQWLKTAARLGAKDSALVTFSPIERKILDKKYPAPSKHEQNVSPAQKYLIKVARLGGYLARAGDKPPGFLVILRGLNKLDKIKEGAILMGN